MQDRYVGDIGDFGKYALLRALDRQGAGSLRLGLNWYMFPDESHNSDGRHIGYLSRGEYRNLDTELHDALEYLVTANMRSVEALAARMLFKPGTLQFLDPIARLPLTARSPGERLADRRDWHAKAMRHLRDASLVFFDPDNGLETASVPKHSPKAGKFVFWSELHAFWLAGKSLVVYHHLNRTMPHGAQIELLREKFRERLENPALLVPLLFRRGSCRVFWVVGQREHLAPLRDGISTMVAPGWARHFTVG
jgi:hypothetical protein